KNMRDRLRRALKKIYGLGSVDNALMRQFLRQKLSKAPVIIFTVDGSNLRRLYRQVAGLIRHGRRVKVIPIR
ncbi:MAG TPA: hypothetical protein VFY26_13745, partial [Anaerolineales bacterium]|nr:hypothetical protein [Anaerolineales bacterium]